MFDRRKSGYVRDFNTVDVFVFNVMGFALGLALSTNPPYIGSFAPDSNILVVILLGASLAICNGLTYGWFGGILQNTGGDYIFVSRSLKHQWGFIASWAFTACQIYGLSMNLGWIFSAGIVPGLVTLGVTLDNGQLLNAGIALGSAENVAIGGVVLLLFYYLLAFFEVGLNRYVVYTLFGVGLLGPLRNRSRAGA